MASDHGHNLRYPDDKGLISKQGHPLTPQPWPTWCSSVHERRTRRLRHPSQRPPGRLRQRLDPHAELRRIRVPEHPLHPRLSRGPAHTPVPPRPAHRPAHVPVHRSPRLQGRLLRRAWLGADPRGTGHRLRTAPGGDAGYRTALFTDCYHQFKPSKNFHRGFSEWQWIRGQETDRFRSGPALPPDAIRRHVPERLPEAHQRRDFFTQYLTNNLFRREEADYYPARLFNDAARWIYDNDDADSFFLVVDSFDPHEPWEPPVSYRRLYDPDDDVTDIIQSLYAPNAGVLTEREVKRVQANYAGEVTLCDRWFGHFMEQLELSGRADDTVVIVASDHGHNLRYPDDKGLISKQGHPLTRAVADLVLLVRYPRPRSAPVRPTTASSPTPTSPPPCWQQVASRGPRKVGTLALPYARTCRPTAPTSALAGDR